MNEEEIKILEEIKEIKIELANEIEAIIEKYLEKYGETDSFNLNKLAKIDIIAVLELVKLRFFEESQYKASTSVFFKDQIGR